MFKDRTNLTEQDDECELGYWLGKPFWGNGLIPEAVEKILQYAFENCGMNKVWCGYYEGNLKSNAFRKNVDLNHIKLSKIHRFHC